MQANKSLELSANARAALSLDKAVENEQKYGNGFDPSMDEKKIRRIMSNRLSAQRARLRKSKYVGEMEKTVKQLEDMILDLTSQLKDHKKKMDLLMVQNQSLQTLLELRLNEARFSEIEVEKNKMEVNRLRDLQIALLFQPLIRNNYVNLGSYNLEANQLCQENMASASTMMPPGLPSLIQRRNPPDEATDQYFDMED